jgi:hypothetical protein
MGAGLCRTRKDQAAADASASGMLASTSALAPSRQSRQVQIYIDFVRFYLRWLTPWQRHNLLRSNQISRASERRVHAIAEEDC